MSAEGYMLRFFWGPRRESPPALSARLGRFLNRLAVLDPLFRNWQTGGKTLKPIARSRRALEELIRGSASRASLPPFRPIPGAGYHLSLYTRAKWVLWLNGYLGAGVSGVNSAVLILPPAGAESLRICRVPVLEELIRAGVDAWDPDEGSVYPTGLSNVLVYKPGQVGVGWLTYVAHRACEVPDLPRPIRTVPINRVGTLITATSQRFETARDAHRTAVEQIHAALNPAKPSAATGLK